MQVGLGAAERGDRGGRGPDQLPLGHRGVGEEPVVGLHIAQAQKSGEQRLRSEAVELEARGQVLCARRPVVEGVEDAEHHRGRHGPGGHQAGEGVEKGIGIAAVQHRPHTSRPRPVGAWAVSTMRDLAPRPLCGHEKENMAYVIAEPCIDTKDNSCVEVCPVDCIHPTPDEPDYDAVTMLYIDPEECIDCDACVEACPWTPASPRTSCPTSGSSTSRSTRTTTSRRRSPAAGQP